MDDHHHHDDAGCDQRLWKLTYTDDDDDDDEIELNAMNNGLISSDENGNKSKTSHLETAGKIDLEYRPGDHHGNEAYKQRGRQRNGFSTLSSKVKKNVQRIKIYERKKKMEKLEEDDDDDYDNQTVVTTYELPSTDDHNNYNHIDHTNHSNHNNDHQQFSGDEEDEIETSAIDGKDENDLSSRKTKRLIIRRDSDLEFLIDRVNTCDPFRGCYDNRFCCFRSRSSACIPGCNRFTRWLESTGIERWVNGWPRFFKMMLVVGVVLLIMLAYASVVTVGVKLILA